MSSIYNTSRTDKGKGRAVPRRGGGGGPMRPGVGPQRVLQQHQLQMQQQQQQAEDITYSEFQLVSTSKRGKNHLMDFKGGSKHVEPKNFARPVKLHRKETNFLPYRQYIQNLNEQNAAAAAAKEAAAANAAAIMAGAPLPHPATKPTASDVEDLGGDAPTPSTQNQHGPKTGADTSLIAPLGGATRNKQMLFKKRTKQIYLAKEDTRELKEQEQRPWILEDYDGQNSFTGTYEGGQRSDYMFFVLTESGFKVMPVDRWYKFQPKRHFKTLSLEEAEEQLKKQQKREGSRWLMLNRKESEAEEAAGPSSKLKLVDHDDHTKPDPDEDSGNRQDSDMDDLDFDDVFQDDDEATAEHEVEDEDVKDSKDRVKKEIKDYSISGTQEDADDQYDDMGKLTSEGKQMRKLVRDLEKNRAYESDDEDGDPYASSAEELDSDNDDDETSENEKEKEKEKKIPVPPKKKATAASKPMMPKKAHTAKIKKESMSKPIGRPGSPSLYMKKKEREGSSSPAPRPSSPLGNGRSSPLRPGSSPQHRPALAPPSPSSSQGFKEPTKKRKLEDSGSGSDSKHRKMAGGSGGGDDDLITEQEVIDTLRGKVMTTKEFLLSFRKRIKKDPRNRDIITTLLRKVAKSNRSSDPNTRTLELKPEFN